MSAPVQLALFDYERAIEHALESVEAAWITIAANLRAIHSQGLYKADYASWSDYCQTRWGKTGRWGYHLIEAGAVVENVKRVSHETGAPSSLRQALALADSPADDQAGAWDEAVARYGSPTGAQVAEVVGDRREPERNKAAMFSSAEQAWNTPPHIIAAALAVLGTIDLDPCSNSEGAPNVPATLHYTEHDNGLAHVWDGRLYINPPYDDTATWVEKLVESWRVGDVSGAILLVAARTDTRWFQLLTPFPVCFIRGRLRFSASENSAPFPSAVFYLGEDVAAFATAFSPYGPIYEARR